ncbi:MAG: GNAT family N-acetyltransferase [Clostridia bacterium]|nr:GNAT family N-acetyltransferase [Clostridia bacterium]
MKFIAKYFSDLSPAELYEILRARAEIFLLEQHIVEQDLDGVDYDCLHCFLWEDGHAVGTLRAFYTDEAKKKVKIGRVVTLTHGKGHGALLMEGALAAIKEQMPHETLYVHAQTQAAGYYKKFGFSAVGEEFDEAGIPHIEMIYGKD